MEHKRTWASSELHALNAIVHPVWMYSCCAQKLLWGNQAALEYFGALWHTFEFSKVGPEESASFQTMNTLLCEEVEQTVLLLPERESTLCTMIQVARSPTVQTDQRTVVVQTTARTNPDLLPSPAGKSGIAAAGGIRMLMTLIDDIISGKPVEMEAVKAVQGMLQRGEIQAQSSQIVDELAVHEELDADVGLNLMELLGSKFTAPRFSDEARPLRSSISVGGGQLLASLPSMSQAQVDPEESSEEARESVIASLRTAMEAALVTVDEWAFDAFKLAEATQGYPLSTLGFYLMERYDIIDTFKLNATKLARFLRKIEAGYPDNPYHNKTHAADVLQGMHVVLTKGGLLRKLGMEMAMLAAYLAAIIHDYEHKGLNNDFLVRSCDDLAITYNDMSPMENHHVAGVFRLLRQQDVNFLQGMPREKYVHLRRLLIDMVMATDMKQHFNILSKFQAKFHNGPGADDALLTEVEADKSLVLQIALKIADVGHLSSPWEVHHRWVSNLEEEFFRQGDRERQMQASASPLMDRRKDGITKSQVGFFDIVALPMFQSWTALLPGALPLTRAVEDNCNRWRALQ